jgi:hypothetical protein
LDPIFVVDYQVEVEFVDDIGGVYVFLGGNVQACLIAVQTGQLVVSWAE